MRVGGPPRGGVVRLLLLAVLSAFCPSLLLFSGLCGRCEGAAKGVAALLRGVPTGGARTGG